MAWDEEEDTTIYRVVMNHEEQYSIWPADRELPLGWNDVGKSARRRSAWTTSKRCGPTCGPCRLRKKMEEMERERQAAAH